MLRNRVKCLVAVANVALAAVIHLPLQAQDAYPSAIIGANHVACAAPDGYTLLLGTNVTHAISPRIMASVPYDPLNDFAPIAMFGLNGNVLIVHPSFPANTFAEFVQYIREKPGDINYASGSVGSSAHLAAELLKQEVPGLDYMHIPYSVFPSVQPKALYDT